MISRGHDFPGDTSMSTIAAETGPTLRERVRALVEHPKFDHFIIALIVLNAITLGMETVPALAEAYGPVLSAFDNVALWVFTIELALRFFVYRTRFFLDPWRVFDFVVVGIAWLPAAGAFNVLRALRILRVLRLVSLVPSMRGVVQALLAALPGMASIIALLFMVIYVGAVMATRLFGEVAPEFFGGLGGSLFTLFQIMTVEGWPDIAREVMVHKPYAWIFFVGYLLVATFMVLNLFIAVVVNAMQSQVADDLKEEEEAHTQQILREVRELRREIATLRKPEA